ncbi:MAG: hypothetical protein L6R39_006937 [Caloplaca ligustica]|nr:MAG: hypothetical protein L6R39_006937 [Caloplaca ligustica]
MVAARLGELKGLKSLKLRIIAEDEVVVGIRKAGGIKVVGQGTKGGGRVATGWKREGQAAEAMLKAEKKVLRELVVGLEGLRVFELRGFVDGGFARRLESSDVRKRLQKLGKRN